MPLLRSNAPSYGRKTVVLFVLLSLGPLALLTISSMTLAERAVSHEVDERIRSTSELSATLVELEMQSIGDLVESYATRRLLIGAVEPGAGGGYDQEVLNFQVNELFASRQGFRGAFLADESCTVVSVQPPSPDVIGRNFALRDWCSGVRERGAPYVSEAYQTAGRGTPLVVVAVAPVRSPEGDGTGKPLAYLAVLYDLTEIQRFVNELEEAQGVALTIIDQRGTVLGAPTGISSGESGLYSRRSDPRLDAALDGRSGSTETVIDGEEILVATSPVADLGWVTMAEVPTDEAFAGVEALRSTVLSVAGILALVLLTGAWFLLRALRLRAIAEATVRAAENRTRGIIDAATDGFVAMGDDGRVKDWNPAAVELFGWTTQEATGRNLCELIVPSEQREAHERGLRHFLRTGEGPILNQRVDVEAVDRAGRRFPVELAVTATRERDQSWTFNAFLHDISERKLTEYELARARDEALEASQLKSEFLANMSHEIRTPMNGVLGMTALLLDTDLDPSQRQDAETVLRSGESLLAIINDILDFSKVEAGQLDFETIEFEIQDLIEDVTGLLAMRAAEKGIELVVYVHADVPAQVKGDPGRVRQIVTNLLGNAVKFTDSGEVLLEVSMQAQQPGQATAALERTLRFEVSDTGIGIAAEQQEAIFQTFTQADSSTTRRYGGTGLGLAISEQLVTLMHGEIGVTSTLGTGSTFWFTLPVTIADPVDHGVRRNDLKGTRVLVVDDSATNREMLGRTLASWGVEHQDVPDASSALDALRDAAIAGLPFDAALLDLHMPDVDGLTLASQIAADPSTASVALVLLTSSGQRGEASRAEAAGMSGYLVKPVHRTRLHSCLATVLGTRSDPTRRPIVTRHQLSEMAPNGGTILVAEDNPVNQRVARGMLERLGYEVVMVSNGREAVVAAASASYLAILMDCQMPEMDGFEATRLIRAAEGTKHRTPIVAVTAAAMEQDRQRCLDAGMDDHLPKPLRREHLAVILEPFAQIGRSVQDTAVATSRSDAPLAGVGDLQSSIRARLDDVFEGLDGDIEADCADLLQSFLRRAADKIELIDGALAVRDAALVGQRAHSLKGMAANLGVSNVATLAAEVEDAARDERLDAIGPVGEDLRLALEVARGDIRAMLPSLATPG